MDPAEVSASDAPPRSSSPCQELLRTCQEMNTRETDKWIRRQCYQIRGIWNKGGLLLDQYRLRHIEEPMCVGEDSRPSLGIARPGN